MKERLQNLLSKILPRMLPNSVRVHYAEPSLVFSAEDDFSEASDSLLSLALDAVRYARTVPLGDLDERWSRTEAARLGEPYVRPSCWPGEHYRLLAGLTLALKPGVIVEVGTGGGLSALAMKAHLPPASKLVTFDIIDWRAGRPFNVLQADFEDGILEQRLGDLSSPNVFALHADAIAQAGMVFIDGPKDGITEQRLLNNLQKLSFRLPPLLVLDDIRLWNMLGIWRRISAPKLDLTSFGHYSGTGLVGWP
jgi:predicted O-methyltransferase YrrM